MMVVMRCMKVGRWVAGRTIDHVYSMHELESSEFKVVVKASGSPEGGGLHGTIIGHIEHYYICHLPSASVPHRANAIDAARTGSRRNGQLQLDVGTVGSKRPARPIPAWVCTLAGWATFDILG